MVWALILSLFLLFPTRALAVPDENVQTVVDSDIDSVESSGVDVSSRLELDGVSSDTDSDALILYSPEGQVVLTTSEPVPHRDTKAFSSSPYASVSDNTYSAIAAKMLLKVGPFSDYVFWRSGQYVYTLAVGDLELNGTTFSSSEDVTLYTFQLDTGYSGTYTLSSRSDTLTLSAGSYIVFSNLGYYPLLDYDSFGLAHLCFLVAVACGLLAIRPIFGFVLRTGVRVHGSHES